MLTELQRITDKDGSVDTDSLRKAASAVLERQFLFADKQRDKGFYSRIIRYPEYFTNLFDALNLDLICDPGTGYLGGVPRGSIMAYSLDIEHTLVLLVLRVIYENTLLECRAIEGGQAETDSDKLMDFYERQTGRPRPAYGQLQEILKTLSRQGLIETDGSEDRVIRVRIRPSIRDIVTPAWMDLLDEYLANREQTQEPDGEDEQTDLADEGGAFETAY